MNSPAWVIEAASVFWHQAGEVEEFPRSLRAAIAFSLPVTVVSLPRLTVAGMNMWLARHGIENIWYKRDRHLRACLVAYSGHGIIFLNSSDLDNEQRFSLAHELAHYLLDYLMPRRKAVERLGTKILEVFDGIRPLWIEERVDALLTNVQIGFHVHLMERELNGALATTAIGVAEFRADRLAFELLAPADAVLEGFEEYPSDESCVQIVDLLKIKYGLPESQAREYAMLIAPKIVKPNNFLERLGLKLSVELSIILREQRLDGGS